MFALINLWSAWSNDRMWEESVEFVIGFRPQTLCAYALTLCTRHD